MFEKKYLIAIGIYASHFLMICQLTSLVDPRLSLWNSQRWFSFCYTTGVYCKFIRKKEMLFYLTCSSPSSETQLYCNFGHFPECKNLLIKVPFSSLIYHRWDFFCPCLLYVPLGTLTNTEICFRSKIWTQTLPFSIYSHRWKLTEGKKWWQSFQLSYRKSRKSK